MRPEGRGARRPDIAAAIREAIVRGDFAPDQRLVESDLSDMFGVGRGSVRAALVELTSEGLVERVQNRPSCAASATPCAPPSRRGTCWSTPS